MKHRNLIIAIVLSVFGALYFIPFCYYWTCRFWYRAFDPQTRRLLNLWARTRQSRIDTPLAKIWRKLRISLTASPLPYRRLDSSKNQIRLLKLLPGRRGDRLTCLTFEVSLDSNDLQYEALSYTWGSPFPVRTIILNHRTFCISANLDAALRSLRRTDEPRVLWVDAICINQLDFAERSQQVRLMRRVYSQASDVSVWLGSKSCHENLQNFFKEANAREDSSAWMRSRSFYSCARLQANFLSATIGDPAYIRTWRELRRLLSRGYWYRVWIIQEVALAPSITVICGEMILSWEMLLFSDSIWKWCYGRRTIEHYEWVNQVVRIPGGSLVTRSFADYNLPLYLGNETQTTVGPASINDTRIDIRSSTSSILSFPELVFRHSKSKATDRKDKIYALIGITADPLMADFVVDYSLSDLEAYQALVKHYICNSRRLDILTYVTTDGNHLRRKRISSWIPDWQPDENFAEARQYLSKLTLSTPFDATRGSFADVQFEPGTRDNGNNPRLRLKGYIIGQIKLYWETPNYAAGITKSSSENEAVKKMISKWYFDAIKHYGNHTAFTNAFWRVLVANRNVDGTMAPEDWAAAFEVVVFGESKLPQDFMAGTPLSIADRAHLFVAPYLSAVAQFMTHRSLFITAERHLGIAPSRFTDKIWDSKVEHHVKPLQYLCIFPGCSFPMIIQKYLVRKNINIEKLTSIYLQTNRISPWKFTDDYELIGCAYVQGYMEGPIVEELESRQVPLCDICLA